MRQLSQQLVARRKRSGRSSRASCTITSAQMLTALRMELGRAGASAGGGRRRRRSALAEASGSSIRFFARSAISSSDCVRACSTTSDCSPRSNGTSAISSGVPRARRPGRRGRSRRAAGSASDLRLSRRAGGAHELREARDAPAHRRDRAPPAMSLELVVRDNGVGLRPDRRRDGMGLLGHRRARQELHGGLTVRARSRRRDGAARDDSGAASVRRGGASCACCWLTITASSAAACVRCSTAEPAIEVVGEAADGLEALRLCEEHRPDVLILDIAMPKLNGIEVAARVAEAEPAAARRSCSACTPTSRTSCGAVARARAPTC